MKRGRPSGWQLSSRKMQRQAVMPESLTKWHLLLYALGIDEKDVRGAITKPGEPRQKIVEFARKHVDSLYVPSWLVSELGLKSRYEA